MGDRARWNDPKQNPCLQVSWGDLTYFVPASMQCKRKKVSVGIPVLRFQQKWAWLPPFKVACKSCSYHAKHVWDLGMCTCGTWWYWILTHFICIIDCRLVQGPHWSWIGGAQQAQTGDQALWQSSGQAWTRQSGRPGNLASKLEPGNRAGLAIWQTWQSSHQSNLSHQDLNGVSETGPQWSFWDRTWMILSGVPQACWAPESAIY